MASDKRGQALRSAAGENYGLIMAQVYIGDQLERIADALEANQTPAAPPDVEYSVGPHRATMPGEISYVPGRLVKRG